VYIAKTEINFIKMKRMKKVMLNDHLTGWPVLLFLALMGGFLLSCNQNDDIESIDLQGGEFTTVNFDINANMLKMSPQSRALTPSYNADGFSIYAYRLADNGVDYEFAQMLTLANPNYSPIMKRLTGGVSLPVGQYKFIPAYGLNSTQNLNIPSLLNRNLTNDLSFSFLPSGIMGNNLPEIFLMDNDTFNNRMEDIRSYEVGLSDELNETVSLQLTRAVGRLDVMFIRARKNGNNYIELAYPQGTDVFGGRGLGKMQFILKNANQNMNFLGVKQPGTLDTTIDVQGLGFNGEAVTIGTSSSASIIGNDDYFRFDSIQTNDIIAGSAHIFGSYMIPNNNADRTVSLQLYIESVDGNTKRTIDVSAASRNILPFERNKVTLVKIYILENNGGIDPPPVIPPVNPPVDPTPSDVYEAAVTFEVELIEEWDDSHYINENIDN